ncbi:hypothetical protein [Rhodococcus sp. YH1]|uniref:hypothetical protein n=1 Tax=Rhodococcus sp. YH1 TaxID=89066 RepID=UPI0013876062|nr:hypothetical protein [Rhodococcus sp. YH1]
MIATPDRIPRTAHELIEALDARDPQTVPHETAAVLRMKRNGWPGPKITEFFRQKPTTTVDQLNKALGEEGDAAWAGRPIHDATVKGRVA